MLPFLLVSTTVLNMLVGLQTYLICSPESVLELANKFIQEGDLKLITLQSVPQRMSLFLLLLFLKSWYQKYSE